MCGNKSLYTEQSRQQRWTQDFPEGGGAPTPVGGRDGADLLFEHFFLKTVENEDILGWGGGGVARAIP